MNLLRLRYYFNPVFRKLSMFTDQVKNKLLRELFQHLSCGELNIDYFLGHGGGDGHVVSVFALYTNDLSSDLTKSTVLGIL